MEAARTTSASCRGRSRGEEDSADFLFIYFGGGFERKRGEGANGRGIDEGGKREVTFLRGDAQNQAKEGGQKKAILAGGAGNKKKPNSPQEGV